MVTYDRNRNPITNGSQVMITGTGKTGKIVTFTPVDSPRPITSQQNR